LAYVLELLEPPWLDARVAAVKRTRFFAHIFMLSTYILFSSWQTLLESLATFSIPPDLIKARTARERQAKSYFLGLLAFHWLA
jgi:hypothetical protein